MSGFSGQWLSLREPVDHRSLNKDVLAAFARYFAGKDDMSIVDLGSGSGSSLRALAPRLAATQKWRLVDHDPKLLSFAREKLSVWAESSRDNDGILVLEKNKRHIEVETRLTDLSSGLPHDLIQGANCVTSSAFFDLVSFQWIVRFVAALAEARKPLLALLTYDGSETWSPPHPADEKVLAAFHEDQHRDKGFGPAAGPQASDALHSVLRDHGFEIISGRSDWQLGAKDRQLMRALAIGSADALASNGKIRASEINAWRESRQQSQACTIGHQDIFAFPKPV